MNRGFTAIEVLMVTAIVVLLAIVIFPVYSRLIGLNSLDSTRGELIQNIRLAEARARSGENNSNFGVYFETDKYTLYRGSSYGSRQTGSDQVYFLSDNVEIIAVAEINFTAETGWPNHSLAIIIRSAIDNREKTININNAGLVY